MRSAYPCACGCHWFPGGKGKTRPCLVGEKKFDLATIAFLFVFDNYCSVVNLLDSKDLSHKLQTNCTINYFLSIFNTSCMHPKIRCDRKS